MLKTNQTWDKPTTSNSSRALTQYLPVRSAINFLKKTCLLPAILSISSRVLFVYAVAANFVFFPPLFCPTSLLLAAQDFAAPAKIVCDVSFLGLIHLGYWYGRQRTPLRDRSCLKNDPQCVPGFLSCWSWMFPEKLWNKSEFVGSKKLDKAPKMRDYVQLNSSESFLVTTPSISSETWVMYSSAIPGLSVFCDWLFLVFAGVSLEAAANFLLFLNVATILRKKLRQLCRLNWHLF